MASYARRTTVPVDRSRTEIEKTLTNYGADQFSSGWTEDKAVIMFRMKERYIRIEMPLVVKGKTRDSKKNYIYGEEKAAQENRRRWRALVLYVKAKLESVESGIISFEAAFMAHVILPNRQTVGEYMQPQIEKAYKDGKMPPLLEHHK
jgi:hypothetical protein